MKRFWKLRGHTIRKLLERIILQVDLGMFNTVGNEADRRIYRVKNWMQTSKS